jgi:tetratricopeptide (TPR) repeat protein
VFFLTPWAGGQTGTAATWELPSISMEEQAARAIQRLALLELRMQPSPSPADYEIAYRTLAYARDLTPDDEELARKMVAAAWGTGDNERLFEATRELVRLDPADTVAQLRLISWRISRAQTAEERLALYGRFLGEGGEALDPSVRSRLALDAALLLREQGDDDGFAAMLDRSLALDGTNKAAAQLAVTYFSTRVDDAVGRFELMLNLLYADPADPNVYQSIAQELADHGVMDQADRFFRHASSLYEMTGRMPPALENQALSIRWQVQGPQALLDSLTRALRVMRQQQERDNAYRVSQGVRPEELVDPGQVRLNPDKDQLRLLAAMAVGNAAEAGAAMSDLEASVRYSTALLADPSKRPEGYSAEAARDQAVLMWAQLQLFRLWSGIHVDEARAEVDEVRGKVTGYEQVIATIEPWLLLREDKFEEALALLDTLGERAGPLGLIARGVACERLGRTRDAAIAFIGYGRNNGLDPVSAWARGHAAGLMGEDVSQTSAAPGMRALAAGVPRFIDDMVGDTSSFMSLRIEAMESPTRVNEPWKVRVRLRNLAPIPLAVGSNRPINSRILLVPKRDSNVARFTEEMYPEVVELNRRLRLMPRESIVADVSVDLGATGLVLALNSLNNNRIRWRAIQGFVLGGDPVSYRPGPMCQSAESGASELRMNPARVLSPQEVGVELRTATLAQLPDMVQLARSALMAWPNATPPPEQTVTTLRDALAARFQRAVGIERAFMLATLPAMRTEAALGPMDEAALSLPGETGFRSTQHAGVVEALILLTRVTDPASPLLADAEANGGARLAAIARLVRERLASGRPCFATAESVSDWFPPTRPESR